LRDWPSLKDFQDITGSQNAVAIIHNVRAVILSRDNLHRINAGGDYGGDGFCGQPFNIGQRIASLTAGPAW
jgi:hypothetical protein